MKKMKVQWFAILLISVAQIALAQTPPAPTLAQNMDSISALVKSITKNVSDSTQNATSAASAGQLVTLFNTALNQVPSSIAALPTNQQAAAISGYQSLIQKEITDAKALQAALLANQNAQASTVLQDMNTIKSQGHSAYAQ